MTEFLTGVRTIHLDLIDLAEALVTIRHRLDQAAQHRTNALAQPNGIRAAHLALADRYQAEAEGMTEILAQLGLLDNDGRDLNPEIASKRCVECAVTIDEPHLPAWEHERCDRCDWEAR